MDWSGLAGVEMHGWFWRGEPRSGMAGVVRTGAVPNGLSGTGRAGNDGIGEVREASNGWARIGMAGKVRSGQLWSVAAINGKDWYGRLGVHRNIMDGHG